MHLVGAIILSTGGNLSIVNRAQIGDLFIIVSMALFASSYSFGKRLAENIGPIYSNAISMGIAGLILLPLMAFSSVNKLVNPLGWVYLLVYVILFNVIGLTLWYTSLKTVKGWIVSALRYIGPILGAPVAYLLLKESLSFVQILGAIIVMFTSFFIVREHIRSK